jgi:hypothetical protein
MYHCGEHLTDDAAGGGRGGRAAEVRSFILHTMAHFRQGLFVEQHVRQHPAAWLDVGCSKDPQVCDASDPPAAERARMQVA